MEVKIQFQRKTILPELSSNEKNALEIKTDQLVYCMMGDKQVAVFDALHTVADVALAEVVH